MTNEEIETKNKDIDKYNREQDIQQIKLDLKLQHKEKYITREEYERI